MYSGRPLPTNKLVFTETSPVPLYRLKILYTRTLHIIITLRNFYFFVDGVDFYWKKKKSSEWLISLLRFIRRSEITHAHTLQGNEQIYSSQNKNVFIVVVVVVCFLFFVKSNHERIMIGYHSGIRFHFYNVIEWERLECWCLLCFKIKSTKTINFPVTHISDNIFDWLVSVIHYTITHLIIIGSGFMINIRLIVLSFISKFRRTTFNHSISC